jgi:hypothetical protein
MIGMDMQRHCEVGFLGERRLTRVDQRPTIALVNPEAVYVLLPPSTVCHTLLPYVVEEDDDQESWVGGRLAYLWRYSWWTTCKHFALRVSVPDRCVVLMNTRVQVYTAMPAWARPCRSCVRQDRDVQP